MLRKSNFYHLSRKKNYYVTDLEGLEIIYLLEQFRQYLISSNKNPIKFISDHKSLLGLFKKSIPNSNRHVQWIEEFNKYKIKLKILERKKEPLWIHKLENSLKEM